MKTLWYIAFLASIDFLIEYNLSLINVFPTLFIINSICFILFKHKQNIIDEK